MTRVEQVRAVRIPVQALSAEALRGIVEAFVLREGTDYGHRDYGLHEKRAAVERQLERGEAGIWFDPKTGTTEIRLERTVGPPARGGANGRDGPKESD